MQGTVLSRNTAQHRRYLLELLFLLRRACLDDTSTPADRSARLFYTIVGLPPFFLRPANRLRRNAGGEDIQAQRLFSTKHPLWPAEEQSGRHLPWYNTDKDCLPPHTFRCGKLSGTRIHILRCFLSDTGESLPGLGRSWLLFPELK